DEARCRNPRPELVPFDLAGVRVGDPGPSLSIDDIRAFEQTIDVELPPEYRWLLLQSNGGKPSPGAWPIGAADDGGQGGDDEDRGGSEVTLTALLRLREADRDAASRNRADIHTVEEMALDWYSDRFEVPPGMV